MSFEAPVQRRSGEVRDRGLEAVEAVVQRQQRMPSERDDLVREPRSRCRRRDRRCSIIV